MSEIAIRKRWCQLTESWREVRCGTASEARTLAILLSLRSPARDKNGLLREARELRVQLRRECVSADDEACPALAEYHHFLSELKAGRLKLAMDSEPIAFDLKKARLTGRETVALLALKRNMWVTIRARKAASEPHSLAAWYVKTARELAASVT